MEEELTEREREIRTRIVAALRKGIVKVTFEKTDGTDRMMRCTLSESYLPPRPKEDEASQRKQRPRRPSRNIVVWDVDSDGWRSFNLPSVLTWDPE